jgi:hypothetical protein
MAIAKSKQWSEADVQEALAVIKAVPGLWEELERVEKASVIDRKTIEAGRREYDVLVRLHPGCDLNELTDLYMPIRRILRKGLGLS